MKTPFEDQKEILLADGREGNYGNDIGKKICDNQREASTEKAGRPTAENRETRTENSVEDILCETKPGFSNVEDILNETKPFGVFQRLLTFLMCLIIGPTSMAVWLTYFIAADIPWTCPSNRTLGNAFCTVNQTYETVNEKACAMDKLNKLEFTSSSQHSIKLHYDIYCDNEWAIHLATSSLFVGWAVGSFPISYLADKRGRKVVLFPSLFVIVMAGFLTIFSPNIEIFIVIRFFIGLFLSANFHVLFIVTGEFVNNKHRPLAVGLVTLANALWNCLLCLKAYYIRDWKILTITTTLPYLFIMFFYTFVPETVHWLSLHGYRKDLLKVLSRICYWNKVEVPKQVQNFSVNMPNVSCKSRPTELFATYDLACKTIRVLVAWITVGMVYFSISMAANDLTGSFYRDFFLIILIEIPTNPIIAYCCTRFGRKRTISLNMFISSAACLIIAFIPMEGNIRFFRLAFGLFGKLCITVVFNAFFSWTMELYGTDLRANAMGLSNVAARLGGAISPWIAKALRHHHEMLPFITMGCLGVIGGTMMCTLAETRGVLLRNISKGKDEEKEGQINA